MAVSAHRKGMFRIVGPLVAVVVVLDLVLARDFLDRQWQEWRLSGRRGFTSRTFVDESGGRQGYVLFVPHHLAKDERPPLILFLNGTGENGSDGVTQISKNLGLPVWEMKRRFPFVVFAPQCSKGGSWVRGSPDAERMLANLDRIIEEYGVDPERLFITGPSAGGLGVWSLASGYPERFAGIVPLAAAGGTSEDSARMLAEANVSIWSFHNAGDSPGLVEFNRDLRKRLIEAGLSPNFTEYDQPGHNCWDDAYRSPALYEWMLSQNKRANAAAPRFQSLVADGSLDAWEPIGPAAWSVEEGELCVEMGKRSDGPSALLYREWMTEFDVHFDYRDDGEGPCEIVLSREPSSAAGGEELRIVIEWPHQGTGGVFDGRSGRWLGAVNPIAQRGLLAGRWNDIRLRLTAAHMAVHVNGLEWIRVKLPEPIAARCRFGLRAGADGAQRRWRYLRMRKLSTKAAL